MAENINLKPITDVPAVEELPEGATVLLNDNGTAKQIPAGKIVAELTAEPMLVTLTALESSGYTSDKTYDEIKTAMDNNNILLFSVIAGNQEVARSNSWCYIAPGGIIIDFIMNKIAFSSDGTINDMQ